MRTISMRFEDDFLDTVDAKARALGISRTELVKHGLKVVLNERQPTHPTDPQLPPPKRGLPWVQVEDLPRGDCPHPRNRRTYISSVGRYRCKACGTMLP